MKNKTAIKETPLVSLTILLALNAIQSFIFGTPFRVPPPPNSTKNMGDEIYPQKMKGVGKIGTHHLR